MRVKMTETVFAISTFLLGGVIGAIVENQLNGGINAAYLAILVLAIALFSVTLMTKSSLASQETHDINTLSAIQDVANRLGLKVSYQELKKIGVRPEDQEDILAKLMREADHEILEVGRSEVHNSKENPDLAPSDVRQAYYDSILKRVESQVAKGISFTYKRICQFPQSGGSFRSLKDEIFINHCQQMILLNNAHKNTQVYVKRTRLVFPISFLIIDRLYLIISVDAFRHYGNTNERYMKGEIHVYDPQQELIKVFLHEWERIENAPDTQTLTEGDF